MFLAYYKLRKISIRTENSQGQTLSEQCLSGSFGNTRAHVFTSIRFIDVVNIQNEVGLDRMRRPQWYITLPTPVYEYLISESYGEMDSLNYQFD